MARFTGAPIGPVDQATRDFVAPLVERAGLVAAFNDAWLLIGGLILLSLLLLPMLRSPARGLAAAAAMPISPAADTVATRSGT